MAENSKIQWTDHTFNAWRGCTKVAAGCTNCYAEATAKRNPGTLGIWGDDGSRVVAAEAMWREPLKWNAAHSKLLEGQQEGMWEERAADYQGPWAELHRPRVFCASLADVFEDWQGPMVNSAGDTLMICPNGHIDGSTWETTPESIECSSECGADMRPMTMADVRARLFELIDATPHLDWLLLTKRPENILKMWPFDPVKSDWQRNGTKGVSVVSQDHRKNVWLLTSVAEQKDADTNIPELLKCRGLAPVLGVSAEPLIGPVDLSYLRGPEGWYINSLSGDWIREHWDHETGPCAEEQKGPSLGWVIAGGESGARARPCNVKWIEDIRDQCAAAGVPCFVKQLGADAGWNETDSMQLDDGREELCDRWRDANLTDPKGGDPDEWPEDLRVREFPIHVVEGM